jgi:hypothetical protein
VVVCMACTTCVSLRTLRSECNVVSRDGRLQKMQLTPETRPTQPARSDPAVEQVQLVDSPHITEDGLNETV